MSTLLLERSPALDHGIEYGADCGLDVPLSGGKADTHGRLTLDDLITGAWEALAVRGAVNCPVCDSQMATEACDVSEESPTGVCHDCGSRLC
jgi:hypothetical protein